MKKREYSNHGQLTKLEIDNRKTFQELRITQGDKSPVEIYVDDHQMFIGDVHLVGPYLEDVKNFLLLNLAKIHSARRQAVPSPKTKFKTNN